MRSKVINKGFFDNWEDNVKGFLGYGISQKRIVELGLNKRDIEILLFSLMGEITSNDDDIWGNERFIKELENSDSENKDFFLIDCIRENSVRLEKYSVELNRIREKLYSLYENRRYRIIEIRKRG